MKLLITIFFLLLGLNCFSDELRLKDVQKLLADREQGKSISFIGPIILAAFDFSAELGMGKGLTVVAISCDKTGGLFLFDAAGKMLSVIQTPSIQELRLFNFDEDWGGVQELIATEVDNIGTGVASYNYHIYQVSNGSFKELWKGESYFLNANGENLQEHQGFIRFQNSGWGDSFVKLVHLIGPMENGRFLQQVFIYKDGHFVERKGPIVAR